jgi:hypothetical protein
MSLLQAANTYLMPPAHTREAREILCPERKLNVVLPCCLSSDSVRAREVARRALAMYLQLPAYLAQWSRLGFGPDESADGGSDRLIDALVAWGMSMQSKPAFRSTSTQGPTGSSRSAINLNGSRRCRGGSGKRWPPGRTAISVGPAHAGRSRRWIDRRARD